MQIGPTLQIYIFRANGESIEEVEERLLDRLRNGETRDDIFVSLFDADDTVALGLLDKMVSLHEEYQVIQAAKNLQSEAQKWIDEHPFYPWQDFMFKVRIDLYNKFQISTYFTS